MKTPNFASQDYYKIRYEKFESNNGITTNGNRIKNIAFIDMMVSLILKKSQKIQFLMKYQILQIQTMMVN